jgi:hypothetical protein
VSGMQSAVGWLIGPGRAARTVAKTFPAERHTVWKINQRKEC